MSARAGIIALLVGLVSILLALEISSPLVLAHRVIPNRGSRLRMRAARHLRSLTDDGRPTVLLAGTLCCLRADTMDNLQEQTPQYQVSRLAMEQTH